MNVKNFNFEQEIKQRGHLIPPAAFSQQCFRELE